MKKYKNIDLVQEPSGYGCVDCVLNLTSGCPSVDSECTTNSTVYNLLTGEHHIFSVLPDKLFSLDDIQENFNFDELIKDKIRVYIYDGEKQLGSCIFGEILCKEFVVSNESYWAQPDETHRLTKKGLLNHRTGECLEKCIMFTIGDYFNYYKDKEN